MSRRRTRHRSRHRTRPISNCRPPPSRSGRWPRRSACSPPRIAQAQARLEPARAGRARRAEVRIRGLEAERRQGAGRARPGRRADRAAGHRQGPFRAHQLRPGQLHVAAGVLDHHRPAGRGRPDRAAAGRLYQGYISSHHLDAMGKLNRATVAKSNADAKAKSLLKLQQQLTLEAQQAQLAAESAYAAEQAETGRLQSSLISYQQQLAAAQLQLATLNNQRATYLAYQPGRRSRRGQGPRCRARPGTSRQGGWGRGPPAQQRGGSGGGGGGGGSGSGGGTTPVATGRLTGLLVGSQGRAAANRALRWLGQPYSWAAGNYNGPTYGVDSPGTDGWNDSTVYGFDCSDWRSTPGHRRASTCRTTPPASTSPPARSILRPASSCPVTCCSGPPAARTASITWPSTSATATWCRRRTPAMW